MSIAYFAHEIADPAVQKRVRMLAAGGREVELLGFERHRHTSGNPAIAAPYVLGHTENGRLVSRAMAVLFAIPRAWGLRSVWTKADAVLARNLEMLVIVALLKTCFGLKTRLTYECLDIHRLMLSRGLAGKIMRWIERACLRQVSLVVTSSPAFEEHYFRAVQDYRGETLIVENKVLALTGAQRDRALAPPAGPPWKIVWCGVLRCQKSFDLLLRIAEAQGERAEIELWGVPDLNLVPNFHTELAKDTRLKYKGPYTDLGAIYAGAHFVWAVDFYEQGGNSDWLLPNRLYEGLYNGVTPIAVADVETARWLQRRNVGVVLNAPLEDSLNAFLETCTQERFTALRRAVTDLDPQLLAFSADNCRTLARKLEGAAV